MFANDNKIYLKKCVLIWQPESRDLACISYARFNFLTSCVKIVFVAVQVFVAFFLLGFLCDLIARAYVVYVLCMVSVYLNVKKTR